MSKHENWQTPEGISSYSIGKKFLFVAQDGSFSLVKWVEIDKEVINSLIRSVYEVIKGQFRVENVSLASESL